MGNNRRAFSAPSAAAPSSPSCGGPGTRVRKLDSPKKRLPVLGPETEVADAAGVLAWTSSGGIPRRRLALGLRLTAAEVASTVGDIDARTGVSDEEVWPAPRRRDLRGYLQWTSSVWTRRLRALR